MAARPSTWAAFTVQAASASAGLSFSWVAASEQTSGRLSQKALPGLKSVASAIAAPASTSARAGRHRPREEECARGQQHTRDVARRQRGDAFRAGRLEMVDRTRAELDRKRDRTRLRELVAVEPQRQAVRVARLEIAASLRRVERAPLEEDIGRLGELRRIREHVGQKEVEIGVGAREPWRSGVRSEPGRDPTGCCDRPQRRKLGLAVEAVARLSLEGRRARAEHPVAVTLHGLGEPGFSGGPGRPHGREDAAARGVQLLVAGAACAPRELLDAVAAERRVRVAVDEARDGAQAAAVELLDVAVERGQLRHRAHSRDRLAVAEHVRALR